MAARRPTWTLHTDLTLRLVSLPMPRIRVSVVLPSQHLSVLFS